MDSTTRHWRFLREGHFDVAETSCSSSSWRVTAAWQSRPFRCSCIDAFATVSCSSTRARASNAKDLIGKRVASSRFLDGYPVDPRYARANMACRTVPISGSRSRRSSSSGPHLRWRSWAHDKSVDDMLMEGEVDALIHSDIVADAASAPQVAQLWPDYKGEGMLREAHGSSRSCT